MKNLQEKYSGHLNMSGRHPPLLFNGLSTSVQEQIYERIREAILTGMLEPGLRLLQEELAAEMAVTPTQVREALLRLEGEGLVNYQPYKGFTVANFSVDDLKEIYFLRGILEGAACALAAKNLTEKELDELESLCKRMEECLAKDDLDQMPKYNASFHEIIYLAAKSPRLYNMIVKLWNGFLKSSLSCLTLRAKESVDEHKAIYQALRKRDPEEAKARIQNHIMSVLGDLTEYWSSWLSS